MSSHNKSIIAHVALGSNIEPKREHLKQAIKEINKVAHLSVSGMSRVYQTVPVGYADQDDFMNMVIAVETDLESHEFLYELQEIEGKLKRVRTIKNGPRTIDLDVILLEDQIIQTEDLQVPHPRMQDRAFVLFPLAELAYDVVVPKLDKTVGQLKDDLSDQEKNDVFVLGELDQLE